MKEFQKRNFFLDDAMWISDRKGLSQITENDEDELLFFVYLDKTSEALDELVLQIRDSFKTSKIIYVLGDSSQINQSSHKTTPVGGDVYVSHKDDQQSLIKTLGETLRVELKASHAKQALSVSNAFDPELEKSLKELCELPENKKIELLFSQVFENKKNIKTVLKDTPRQVAPSVPDEIDLGDDMSDKDQELSLDELGDLELGSDGEIATNSAEDEGLDLAIDDESNLDLSEEGEIPDLNTEDSDSMDFDLGDESLELGGNQDEQIENIGELSFDESESELPPSLGHENEDLTKESDGLNFNSSENNESSEVIDGDLSDEAMQKLKEIDAIMDFDASQVEIKAADALSEELEDDLLSLNSVDDSSLELSEDLLGGDNLSDNLSDDILGENGLSGDLNDDLMSLSLNDNLSEIGQAEISDENNLDTPLVSDDLDLDSIDFSAEEPQAPVKEEKSKKKPSKETQEERPSFDGSYGKELREISGAYSGEMERMQATISNLRLDREELLTKIQNLEEGKIIQNRQQLTMRAELDEKKIELSIIRKKLNDEIGELKDRVKLFEEKKLILEEKNKILLVELDKSAQKNKIDIKKIQLREKELEQKLELLKSDSEAQIRNRDLKILELKRKLDSMEFDMESISVQEKKSVESRFELEDKLDKAIKTLRSAISVLEDETDKKTALEALKKNIDM
jgi:hypothetical protein